MTTMPAGAPLRSTASSPSRPALRLVRTLEHDHDWRLRDVEYDEGRTVRRFECDDCGGVDFH